MADFSSIVPACLLTLGVMVVLVADLVTKGRKPALPIGLALATLVGAGLWAWGQTGSSDVVLGVLRADRFGLVMTSFCCLTGIITIVATMRGEAFRTPGGEYLTLILAAVLGMSVLSMSVDLICLYLAFETVSIPSYVLVGMRRADLKANEASMKYVLFGAVSSGAMIYGLSLLVGLAGSTSLDALGVAIANGAGSQPIFFVAVALMLAGFAFKISAVPFHFWAPDVYAGAPAAVGGFLAVASKAAGFAALVRVVAATVSPVASVVAPGPLLPEGSFLLQAIAVIAVLTMTVGNLGALRQREIKRLLAWSSIAHAGYILMAIAIWSERTLAALVFYLVAYLFMNLAAFFLAGMVIRRTGTGELSAFRHLARRNAWLAVALTVVLFSLTGLPPFMGFVGKLQLFYGIFDKGYAWLGVIGLVNGVISLYYYARVIAIMYPFGDDEPESVTGWKLGWTDKILSGALVAPVVIFGIAAWGPIWVWATEVVNSIFAVVFVGMGG